MNALSRLTQVISACLFQDVSRAVAVVPHGLASGVTNCGERGACREAHGGGDGGGEWRSGAMVFGRHRPAIGVIGDGAGESEETPTFELQGPPRPINVLLCGLNARWQVRRRRRGRRRRVCRSKRRNRRRRVDVRDAKARPKGGAVAGFKVSARLRCRRWSRLGLTGSSMWVDGDVGVVRSNGELRGAGARRAAHGELGVATSRPSLVVAAPRVAILNIQFHEASIVARAGVAVELSWVRVRGWSVSAPPREEEHVVAPSGGARNERGRWWRDCKGRLRQSRRGVLRGEVKAVDQGRWQGRHGRKRQRTRRCCEQLSIVAGVLRRGDREDLDVDGRGRSWGRSESRGERGESIGTCHSERGARRQLRVGRIPQPRRKYFESSSMDGGVACLPAGASV